MPKRDVLLNARPHIEQVAAHCAQPQNLALAIAYYIALEFNDPEAALADKSRGSDADRAIQHAALIGRLAKEILAHL